MCVLVVPSKAATEKISLLPLAWVSKPASLQVVQQKQKKKLRGCLLKIENYCLKICVEICVNKKGV